MKKLLLSLSITICFLFSVNEKSAAQFITLTDTAWVNWLSNNGFSACLNGNQLDTTCSDLDNASSLSISGINIHDVTGIKYFEFLTWFHLNNTSVDSIFQLPNSFGLLDFDFSYNNQLKYIDFSSLNLIGDLNISHCAFADLPTFPSISIIGKLFCSYNNLSNIFIPNFYYQSIDLSHNQLWSLHLGYISFYDIEINDNPNLYCIQLLQNTSIDTFIYNNTGLQCLPQIFGLIYSFPDYNSFPNCAVFNPNGCAVDNGVAGIIFNDTNSNCTHDSGEYLLGGIPVRLYSNGTLVQQDFTNNLGNYSFFTPQAGTYIVKVDTSFLPFNIICPTSGADTAVISLTDTLDNDNDFSLQCSSISDGVVSSVVNDSSFFHPDGKCLVSIFGGDIFLFYNTNCSGNLSGTVTATFSGPVSYDGVKVGSLAPTVTGNTLTWTISDFNTVDPYHDFHVRFITDTSAALGSAVCINATISINQTDANAANNSASNCFVVQSSFDPNYKEVNSTSLTYQPIPLTYTIHFQNTGTASADNIYILDTLDSELDLNSFRFLGASHYCIPQILQSGILRFNFPNINLPDSNSNESASHGWVQYSIEQRSDIDPMTVIIENTANIYFDFNSAVVTNTTVTPFAEGIEEQKTASDFILYPNPANTELTVMLLQALNDNYTIEIKDALGRKLFSKIAEQKKQSLNISSLPSGIYFVEVFSSDGYSSTKKLVVVK